MKIKPITFSILVSLVISVLFIIAICLVLNHYSWSLSKSKDYISIIGSYFSAAATLGAAIVAAYLFNNWKEQHNKLVISKDAREAFKLIHDQRNIIHAMRFELESRKEQDPAYGFSSLSSYLEQQFSNLTNAYNEDKDKISEFTNLVQATNTHKAFTEYLKYLQQYGESFDWTIEINTHNDIDTYIDIVKKFNELNNSVLTELKVYIFAQT